MADALNVPLIDGLSSGLLDEEVAQNVAVDHGEVIPFQVPHRLGKLSGEGVIQVLDVGTHRLRRIVGKKHNIHFLWFV